MQTLTMTLTPRSEKTTITYEITGIDPADTSYDIKAGADTLFPARITLDYRQAPDLASPQHIEVTLRGYFRDPAGMVSYMTNTAEVWREIPAAERSPWVAELVKDNTPAWWNE